MNCRILRAESGQLSDCHRVPAAAKTVARRKVARMPMPLAMSLAALLLMSPLGVLAQTLSPNVIRQIAAISAEKESRTPQQAKIDSQLLYASRTHRGISLGAGVPAMLSGVEVDSSGRTTVDISASVSDVLLGRIRSLGGTIVNSFSQYDAIRAIVPIDSLEDLAALPEVRFIRPADMGTINKVVSEGDITHRANLARSKFGVNGAGITVGVMSDSVEQLSTLQAGGNLPPNCPAGPPCVKVLTGQQGTGISEGTAMMEIVNSLAPGSNLIFATANGGEAAFASNNLALQAAGVQVIVDDFVYYSEPTFQDGIVPWGGRHRSQRGDGICFVRSARVESGNGYGEVSRRRSDGRRALKRNGEQ
jgi:hypothetical protein